MNKCVSACNDEAQDRLGQYPSESLVRNILLYLIEVGLDCYVKLFNNIPTVESRLMKSCLSETLVIRNLPVGKFNLLR